MQDDRVTLHVSVWVEIVRYAYIHLCVCHAPRERVSWNNKWVGDDDKRTGHAPRERVSWNVQEAALYMGQEGHAPRERVSWNSVLLMN